jgi:hypothetical protein
MGVDTFAKLAPSRCINVSLNGKVVKVAVFKWFSRYSDWDDAMMGDIYRFNNAKDYAMMRARIARTEAVWNYVPSTKYAVIMHGDKLVGEEVLVEIDPDMVWYHDCNRWGDSTGKIIAKLTRKAGLWMAVDEYKCWDCKDTGASKVAMERGYSMATNHYTERYEVGSVCHCRPGGVEQAKALAATKRAAQLAFEAEKATFLDKMADQRNADKSLDSSGL